MKGPSRPVQSHPELKESIAALDRITQEADRRYRAREEKIKTPEHVVKLTEDFRRQGMAAEGSEALAKCKAYTEAIVEVGDNQDQLAGELRWVVRALRQKAGLLLAVDAKMAPIAAEIRAKTQEILKNPAGHGGARHQSPVGSPDGRAGTVFSGPPRFSPGGTGAALSGRCWPGGGRRNSTPRPRCSPRPPPGGKCAPPRSVRHGKDVFARSFGGRSPPTRSSCWRRSRKPDGRGRHDLVDRRLRRRSGRQDPPEFSAPRNRIAGPAADPRLRPPGPAPENRALRSSREAVAVRRHDRPFSAALRAGTKYSYSSMGILLAAEAARRITSTEITSSSTGRCSSRWR
jgi:hypothetical protein